MTCVVGIAHRGKVYMGADSAATGGSQCMARGDSKLGVNGDYLIGFAGSFRIGQVALTFPTPRAPKSKLVYFMRTTFVTRLREALSEDVGEPPHEYFELLVGVAGRLFRIAHDFHVAEPLGEYASIGGAEDFALGNLIGSRRRLPPKDRILEALRAAETFSNSVKKPFRFGEK